MKQHYCSAEKTTIAFEGECNWCGEKEVDEEKDYDMTIHTNPDAREWAKFFRETNPDCNVSDDIMTGWFANAMMAMHDHLVLKGNPINGDHAQYLIDKAKGVE
jgi:hypothetical protein